jgi:hypothetical protein
VERNGVLRAASLSRVNGLTCRDARCEHYVCGDGSSRMRRSGVDSPRRLPFSLVSAVIVSLWTVAWNERGTSSASLGLNSMLIV